MKKVIISIAMVGILVCIVSAILFFTGTIGDIRTVYCEESLPRETVTYASKEILPITYTYTGYEESFTVQLTDVEWIKKIRNAIMQQQLVNYTGEIGLDIMGEYRVSLDSSVYFEFDRYETEGFVKMHTQEKTFLTKLPQEILDTVMEVVDVRLTENIEKFQTEAITITKTEKQTDIEIRRKTVIDYVLEQCKQIFVKEIDYEPTIVAPDYILDFQNGVEILQYAQNDRGFLLQDGFLYEAYGLNVLETCIQNTWKDREEKEALFTTQSVSISSPENSITITDEDVIEKIASPLIYSSMLEPEWLATYDLTEEYERGIKVQFDACTFLIPGGNIGNRYIITENNRIRLCFPLQELETYLQTLLEGGN